MQALAASAVSWCKSHGGQVPKTDLVAKISRVGGGGKHPQNCERDLQRTIQRFGKSAGIKIDTAKVRLYDPTTSAIYSVDMPLLDPVALATAVWNSGQDIFQEIFLGKEGCNGADTFWRNAKQNCTWFRDNQIPRAHYRGLIPISLYGDEVQAYRNSDPGSIAVVGWVADFGYSCGALLQNFLTGVYSEYTACEHTYDDILEYLLQRIQHMCDYRVAHPWHSGGFRYILAGVRGDLKWLNAALQQLLYNSLFLNPFRTLCTSMLSRR